MSTKPVTEIDYLCYCTLNKSDFAREKRFNDCVIFKNDMNYQNKSSLRFFYQSKIMGLNIKFAESITINRLFLYKKFEIFVPTQDYNINQTK